MYHRWNLSLSAIWSYKESEWPVHEVPAATFLYLFFSSPHGQPEGRRLFLNLIFEIMEFSKALSVQRQVMNSG